jgi:hypothetical protein
VGSAPLGLQQQRLGGSGATHSLSSKSFSPRLHGSTKLAGEGRQWTMRCVPSISIVAQSLCMAMIWPPEMRHSRSAPFRWSSGRVG